MGRQPRVAAADAGTPASIEAALRRVRALAGLLILVRFITTSSLPNAIAVLLVCAFWSVNIVSYIAQRGTPRTRTILGVIQLAADTAVVLLVVWAQHGRTSADSADWAVLVLPVIEGAIRFQIPGAVASWIVLAGTYWAWNSQAAHPLPMSTLAQRLTVVFLVALPSGFLAEVLVAEIAAHRRGRDEAERRSALLKAAALGGQRSTRLDVDEILGVLRHVVEDMGFADAQVFELFGSEPPNLTARPVRESRDVLAIPPGDPRLLAAAAARAAGKPTVWPPGGHTASGQFSTIFALPITTVDDALIVVTARWPEAGAPPDSQTESLELFADQAGASLRNAQVHREMQSLKDRLAHEASHDPLTELPNRRRFHRAARAHVRPRPPGRPDRGAVPRPRRVQGRERPPRPRRRKRPARGGLGPPAQLCAPRRRRRPHGRRRVHDPAHAARERRTGRRSRGADRRDVPPAVPARERHDQDLHEHRDLGGPGRGRRPGRSAAASRRRDVSREVAGQGGVGDGPDVTRARRRRLRTVAPPSSNPCGIEKSRKLREDPRVRGFVVQRCTPFPLVDGGHVNRSQLLNEYAERNELTRKEADALLTSLTDLITATVASGEDVAISGFAKFRRIDRPARMARNPATGDMVKVAAKRVARITPLKAFKDAVLSGKAPRKAPAKKAAAKKAPAKKAPARKPAKKTAKRR
jgi:DNA-binding protein HU-beta